MMPSVTSTLDSGSRSGVTDEVARTTPATPPEIAGRLRLGVTRLARVLRQQADAGLTPTQLAALATIDRCGPLPLGALAEAEQVAAPTVTKIVDKLEDAGWVTRQEDPQDRRVKQVAVSRAGRTHLHELRARKTAWLSTRLSDLSDGDLRTLDAAAAILDRLTAPPTAPPNADEDAGARKAP